MAASPRKLALFIAPTGPGVGLTSVSLGVFRSLQRAGRSVGFFKPIQQPGEPTASAQFLQALGATHPTVAMAWTEAERKLGGNRRPELLQNIVQQFGELQRTHDVVIVEGLAATGRHPTLDVLNAEIAQALDAQVIIVSTVNEGVDALDHQLELALDAFEAHSEDRITGVIVNKVNEPRSEVAGMARTAVTQPAERYDAERLRSESTVLADRLPLLGAIPWDPIIASPRMVDVAEHLGATVVEEGDLRKRRVVDVSLMARTVANITHRFRPGALIVTPGDRDDVFLAVSMAVLNGVPLAGIVFTGGLLPSDNIMRLCARAIETGLPMLSVPTDSYVTAARAAAMPLDVRLDDTERMERVMESVAEHLDLPALLEQLAAPTELRLSPPAFFHRLSELAAAANKTIVLPEGTEPRTIRAAALAAERGVAKTVLLGNPEEIRRIAEAKGITLSDAVTLIDPTEERIERYVAPMVELRKHKGLTADGARNQLRDPIVVGTMMLATGEVDGLVAGAENTTAATVRPALQLIKTKPDAKLVSSVFFMCLPYQVLVYGDCAVNPDPNAEELADIAIQSSMSAVALGIEPRIAMLSYSTGESGTGTDVDKVREATRIVQRERPDLLVDGPLQYDAARVPEVAKTKAPNSPVAGRATVLIFPDLNSGNATYKAVQRAANVVSVGPMLQGLRRPVNDLSRGALVDDILYTIALTAIQAGMDDGETEG